SFAADAGIRALHVTGVETCALPILPLPPLAGRRADDRGSPVPADRPRRGRPVADVRRPCPGRCAPAPAGASAAAGRAGWPARPEIGRASGRESASAADGGGTVENSK